MPSIIGATRLLKYKRHEAKQRQPKTIHKCYKARKRTLGECGYGSYDEYLASEDWARIRRKKLARFPECLTCGRKSEQVHHLDYNDATLLGLRSHTLVTLCGDCHEAIEFDEAGGKRSLRDANKALRVLAAHAGKAGHRWLSKMKAIHKAEIQAKRARRKSRGGKGKK